MQTPEEESDWFLRHPAYKKAKASVQRAHKAAAQAIAALNTAQAEALDAMRRVVQNEAPDLSDVVVKPEMDDEPEDAVFDSCDDFVTATLKLKGLKALSPEDEDEGADEDA
jgi:hypothetical protein